MSKILLTIDDHIKFVADVNNTLLVSGAEIIYVNVDYFKFPRILIKKGLLPDSDALLGVYKLGKLHQAEYWFQSWYNNASDTELLFWFGKDSSSINNIKKWYLATKNYVHKKAIEQGSSFGLYFNYPQLLYSKDSSFRPITNMEIFNTRLSLTIPKKDISNNYILNGKTYSVIPVTRYSSGMSKGLYYDDLSNKSYCGVFYYYEPNSSTYLLFQTSITSINKYHAIMVLIDMINRRYGLNILSGDYYNIEGVFNEKEQSYWISLIGKNLFYKLKYGTEKTIIKDMSLYSEDFMLTPKEVQAYEMSTGTLFTRSQFMNKNIPEGLSYNQYLDILPDIKGLDNNKRYYYDFNAYASEDNYDQPLCNIAYKLGIDVIILTKMIGSRQLVTEILDTRGKPDSFNFLLFTE
jgi:hypothetical protein